MSSPFCISIFSGLSSLIGNPLLCHRSLCSVVCKWNYQADGTTQTWDDSFLKQIGLEDLTDNNYARIGKGKQRLYNTGSLGKVIPDILILY